MPPRKRNSENRGLPNRWRFYHGAYYYQVPPGLEHLWGGKKQFRLGTTLREAHLAFGERVESARGEVRTIGEALGRYALEEVPNKAPKTQRDNLAAIKRLRAVFGHMPLLDFRSHHAYGYQSRRGKEHPTAANRELEVLSHMFTMCFKWGVPLPVHPMRQGKFMKLSTPPRDRYVEDREVVAALSIKSRRKRGSVRMCQAYIKLKLLTGLRRKDMLLLRVTDAKDDGIHVMPRKTAKTTGRRSFREWNDHLREAWEECVAARPVDLGPFVFCNRRGESYYNAEKDTANGFESIWGRFMDRVLAETEVSERFTEHDLRAKCASDAETLQHARELLDHATDATTNRVYRRRSVGVKPGRGIE